MSDYHARVLPYLQLRNVSHRYDQKLAIKDISLNVARSEILALLGPSGSGKSTLLAAIAGIVKPHTGEILVDGRNLLDLPPEARGLGMVFQDYALWPHLTVAQNVAFPLRARKYPSRAISDRVDDALKRVGFTDSNFAVPISYREGSNNEWLSPAPSPRRRNCFCSMNRFPPLIRQHDPASAANWRRYCESSI